MATVTQPDLFAPVYSEERRVWWIRPRVVNAQGFFEDAAERQPYEGIRCNADFWYFPTYREFINVGHHLPEWRLADGPDAPPRKPPKGFHILSKWVPGGVDRGCRHGAEGGGFVDQQVLADYRARHTTKPSRNR